MNNPIITEQYRQLLQTYLHSRFPRLGENGKQIASYFHPVSLSSGQHFLKESEKANALLFITNGVMRTHWTDSNGNDQTNFFFKENRFLTGLESYLSGKPSPTGIQAITDCNGLIIQKPDEQILAQQVPAWSLIFDELVRYSLLHKIADVTMLKSVSAKEKYQRFIQTNGDIALRIPLQYIASYLGITPQSLSRIRRSHP